MRILKILLVLFITVSCGSSKKAARIEAEKQKALELAAPSWTKKKPINGAYYHGIGFSVKSGADYMNNAKNNALSDLASEISVRINTSSMLYQVEQDDKFREEFKNRVQTSSLEEIEGYELVDSYEDGRYYYVYYQLSKAKHAALKEEKKQKALAKSKDLQLEAENYIAKGNYSLGIITHVKAIESIKSYLGETLQTQWKGEEKYYGNVLAQFLRETLSKIRITPEHSNFSVKRGERPAYTDISFIVTDDGLNPLENMPVYSYYSGHRIKNNSIKSNYEGRVNVDLGKIESKKIRETVQVHLNLVEMVKEATEDPIIALLVTKLSVPQSQMIIEIQSPKVFLSSTERINNKNKGTSYLLEALKASFVKEGAEITINKRNADFIVEVDANTIDGNASGRFYSSTLNGTLKIYSSTGTLVYSKQMEETKGVQLNYDDAAVDAYQKAAKEISRVTFFDIKRKLFE